MESLSPSRTVNYGERWSDLSLRIVDPLDPDEARDRHDEGKLYAAILGDPDRPDAHLNVRLEVGYVAVHFLDGRLFNDLSYAFRRDDDSGDLFLEQATWRVFDDDGEVTSDTHYVFEAPNIAHVAKRDYGANEQTTYDVEADLEGNREPVPAFGDYESVARRER